MTVMCANCVGNPGRDAWSKRGTRHATGHRKNCEAHHRNPRAWKVETLRGAALACLHRGESKEYAAMLRLAHQFTPQARP